MKFAKSHRLSLLARVHLRKLPRGKVSERTLCKLENAILKEMMDFLPDSVDTIVRSYFLTLSPGDSNIRKSTWEKLQFLLKVLNTRGQLRWLCYHFFTPVLERSNVITRKKLLFTILLNWSKFSEEVLSRLSISKNDNQGLRHITLDEFVENQKNPSFDKKDTYVLEGEYKLSYQKDHEYLKKYLFGRIIMWNSHLALNLLLNSPRLRDSFQLSKYIEKVPDFHDLVFSAVELSVFVHPRSGDTLDQRKTKYNLDYPDSIKDIEIWHQRFIVSDKKWILIDATTMPQLDFVAGHWQFLEQDRLTSDVIRLKKPKGTTKIHLNQAIFLMGRVDENWYHFLLDTLARYPEFESTNPDIPVLVRGDLPQSMIDFLNQVTSRKLIFVNPGDLVTVDLLFYIAARSTVYDSTPVNGDDRVRFSPISLARLKKCVSERMTVNNSQSFPSSFYIIRDSKYRNLVNQQSVVSELCRAGFSIVDCTSYFFENQFHYFAQAKNVVSPGGAVLANMLFMDPGSRITVLRSWRGSDLRLWKKLAEACHLEYDEVVGIPTYFGTNSLSRQHSNFFLPKIFLRNIN